MNNLTRELAEWIAGVSFESLPPSIVEQAKRVVLDSFGECLFVGRTKPWGQTIARFAAVEPRAAESTIIGSGKTTFAPLAALANGTMALGFELADVLPDAGVRPYAVTVPPALAISEARARSGRELITAIVVGYEVLYRISIAMDRDDFNRIPEQGLYPPAVLGTFGAAAAAGKAVGLDASDMNVALGIAGALTGGTFQGHDEGAWTRCLNGGLACERGVKAVQLAEAKFEGPLHALEGPAGFYSVFAGGKYHGARILEDLGTDYVIGRTWTKAFPVNGTMQSAVEALLTILTVHNLSPQDIAAIRASWVMYLPFLGKDDVWTPVAAQASLPFVLASAAARGKIDPSSFTDEAIFDPDVRKMLAKVRVEKDLDLWHSVGTKGFPARVTVHTTRGEELTEVVLYPKGHPANPMTNEELTAKFMALAEEAAVPEDCAEEICESVSRLDTLENLSELTKLLEGGAGVASAS